MRRHVFTLLVLSAALIARDEIRAASRVEGPSSRSTVRKQASNRVKASKPLSAPTIDQADITEISGGYLSGLTPIGVSTGPSGITEIEAGSWDAVGFFDGVRFVGLMRSFDEQGMPVAPGEYDPLRFEVQQDRTINAVLGASGSGKAMRMEHWTRRNDGRVNISDPVPISVPDLDSDPTAGTPRFGEYVYVEQLPEAVAKTAPYYPPFARKSGVDGTVMLQALIGKDGRVSETHVTKSIPLLDRAAQDAVRQWTFKPVIDQTGQPAAVWIAVPVRFSLH